MTDLFFEYENESESSSLFFFPRENEVEAPPYFFLVRLKEPEPPPEYFLKPGFSVRLLVEPGFLPERFGLYIGIKNPRCHYVQQGEVSS